MKEEAETVDDAEKTGDNGGSDWGFMLGMNLLVALLTGVGMFL